MTKIAYIATFSPQAWVNDYAVPVDAEGDTQWDCSAYFTQQSVELQQEMLEDSEAGNGSYNLDDVREDENTPEWIRDWTGPFEISVAKVVNED